MAQNPLFELLGLGQRQPKPVDPYANEMADLFGLQGQFGDEALERAIMAERGGAPPNVASSFGKSANRWKGQQALTMAGMEPTPQMAELSGAVSEGFGLGPKSPVQDVDPVRARNIYKRQQAQEKMRQPIQQDQMQIAGDLQKQQLANTGQLDIAKFNNQAMSDRNAEFLELQRLMNADGGPPVQRVTLPSKTGGGGFAMERTPAAPNQAGQLNQLAVIRGNLAKQGVQDPFANFSAPKSQDEANFVQAVNGLIAQAPLDPSVKQGVIGYLRDPASSSLPLEELFDLSQATPQERAALVNLFTQIRGY